MTITGVAAADTSLDLSPASGRGAQWEHAVVELEVGGHLLLAPPNTASKDEEKPQQQVPISVHAAIEYDQWRLPNDLAAHWAEGSPDALVAMRHYTKAEAVIKAAEGGQQPTLPDDRRTLLVRRLPGQRATFWCPSGRLEREQLDLIDIVGNTLALPELLPGEPLVETQSWKQDAAVMATLLGLDEVAVCEVESIVEKHGNRFIQVRLAGSVHGTIDAAATEMELQGVYLFDRQDRRISNFNLAIKEKRSVGHATPGLDVVAKVKLRSAPGSESDVLSESALAKLTASEANFDDVLVYKGRSQGFGLEYGPQWFVTGADRESVTFRRLDQGDLVAHCTIARLPQSSPEQLPTLEEFQKDVQFSLRENFGQFVKARQWTTPAEYRCYGVVARGSVEEIPVQWRYYLLLKESGERATLAFTIEERMIERLGDADLELVEALELVAPEPGTEPAVAAEVQAPSTTSTVSSPTSTEETRNRSPRRVGRRRGGPRLR